MTEYTVALWEILLASFIVYQIGLNVGYHHGVNEGEVEPKIVKINIEQTNGILYAYDLSGKFIAQAKTYKILQETLKLKSPETTFIAPNDQVEMFGDKDAGTL